MTDISAVMLPPAATGAAPVEAPARPNPAPAEAAQAAKAMDRARVSIGKDAETGDFVYRFFNKKTGELIYQWPAEEILAVKRAMGRLFDERA